MEKKNTSIMPPKKSTRTQLHVTDSHETDDTLQVSALAAKCVSPMVLPEAEIDVEDDDDMEEDGADTLYERQGD
jgi:hypothetical protein